MLLGAILLALCTISTAQANTSRATMLTGLAEPSMGFEMVNTGNYGHVAGQRTDGSVWLWGLNDVSQVGDGTTTNRNVPVEMPALQGASAVLPGGDFTIALMPDGRVLSFGDNWQGSLGDGTLISRTTPVQAVGMTNARFVSVGNGHSMAIKADGTVWAWGGNGSGQLGDGTKTLRQTPVQIAALTGARALELGEDNSFAIMADGSVMAWGENSSGQLGNGLTTDLTTPTTIASLAGARQIVAGSMHTMAIMANGTVKTWGDDSDGQLANGAAGGTITPTAVPALAGARFLSTADMFSMAILANGTVVGWGANFSGQLGLGDLVSRSSPTAIPVLAGARYLSLGFDQSFAISRTGQVLAAGDNQFGQLGDGSFTNRSTFVTSNFTCGCGSFVKVIAGGYFSAGIKADGTTWIWGWNNQGQLGLGRPIDPAEQVTTPQRLDFPGGRLAHSLFLGSYHAMAVMDDGTVWGWGDNSEGQLGIGSLTDQNAPVQIAALTGARELSLSYYNSHALMADGTVLGMGEGLNGKVGDGGTTRRTSPVAVTGADFARQVVAGRYSYYASMTNGTVRSWGEGNAGGLGHGDQLDKLSPTQVAGIDGAREIASGAHGAAVILADGTYRTSGRNAEGQIGNGTTTNQLSFTTIAGAAGGRSLSAGRYHYLITTGNGTVQGVGYNSMGQLGVGDNTNRTTYTTVVAVGLSRDMSLGGYNSITLDSDGVFRTWGSNTHGQMGNGTTTDSNLPAFVSSGCEEPAAPSVIDQYRSDGTTVIVASGWTNQTSVVFKFSASDPDWDELLTPWVEVTTGAFTGSCGQAGANMFSGPAVPAATPNVPVILTVTATGLTSGSAYRWRACTSDIVDYRSAWTAYGNTPDFSIENNAPLLPTLVSPAVGAAGADSTPDFTASYTDSAPAISGGIRVRVGTSSTCGSAVVQTGLSGSVASGANATWTSPALADGTYYWCAQAQDGAGNTSAWTGTSLFTVGAPTLTVGVSAASIPLGTVLAATDIVASFNVTVDTNSRNGYQLTATDGSNASAASCVCGGALPDWTGTDATPTVWAAATPGFGGLTVRDATGGRLAKWGTGTGTTATDYVNNKYAGVKLGTSTLLHQRSTFTASQETIAATWRANFPTAQQGGVYTTTVQMTAVALP